MAIGNGGGGFRAQDVQMHIGGAPVIRKGGLHPRYDEQTATAALAGDDVSIDIKLGNGAHSATIKTCDLTRGYIDINAAYRS